MTRELGLRERQAEVQCEHFFLNFQRVCVVTAADAVMKYLALEPSS